MKYECGLKNGVNDAPKGEIEDANGTGHMYGCGTRNIVMYKERWERKTRKRKREKRKEEERRNKERRGKRERRENTVL